MRFPYTLLGLVIAASLSLNLFIPLGLPTYMAPLVSTTTVLVIPNPKRSSQIAKPAALGKI